MPWMSLQDAAARLGVSQDTIRRRIRRGELVARREPTPQGYRWAVELPEAGEGPMRAPGQGVGGAQAGGAQALQDLVDALRSQVEAQRGELEARRREVQELHVLLGQAQRALPAPRGGRRRPRGSAGSGAGGGGDRGRPPPPGVVGALGGAVTPPPA